MNMPKVSIIVPIYKVEKYITRCIDTLINQTLSEIEIILVDDGSPDKSGKIADIYAIKDSRVKVIHKENGGVSSARNAGIEVATGDYLGFVDSDDWIQSNMYEEMYGIAKKQKCDIVMCDHIIRASKYDKKITANIPEGYYTKTDIIESIYPELIMDESFNRIPVLSVCSCIYRLDFLNVNKIMFDTEVKYSEDYLFNSLAVSKANSFYYLKDKYYYNYFYNETSISKTYKKDSWEVYLYLNQEIDRVFHDHHEYDFTRQIKLHQIYFALATLRKIINSNLNIKNKLDEIKRVMESERLVQSFNNLKLPNVNLKLRIVLYLIKYRKYKLYYILFAIIKVMR